MYAAPYSDDTKSKWWWARSALVLPTTSCQVPTLCHLTFPRANKTSRNYVFTINDKDNLMLDTVLLEAFKACPQVRYVVFQEESGGENHTKHYQGYVELKSARRLTFLKKIAQGHYEVRRGTREQARDYAMKEDTRVAGPWEYGEWISGQGARSDLDAAASALREGGLQMVLENHLPTFIRHSSGFERAAWRLSSSNVREKVEVTLLYGPTGTGKTKYVYDKHPNLYRKTFDDSWFDGYEDQKVLLLDDFSGKSSKMGLTYLLCLLDRYPVTVNIKMSKRNLMAEHIYITTNIHPYMWYDYLHRQEHYKALARRIHRVIVVHKPNLYWDVSPSSFFEHWAEGCDEETVFCDATQNTDDVIELDL